MYSTLLSFNRRALRLSSIVVVGLAALAACDNDQPLAPKPTAVAATPANLSLGPLKSGNLVLKLVDKNSILIPTGFAQFEIRGPNGIPWYATDNGQNDSDPTVGQIVVKNLSPGNYKACDVGPPNGYGVVGASCKSTGVYVGATSGLWFTHGPIVTLKWSVKDSNISKLVGGALFSLDSTNVLIGDIGDNSQSDSDPVGGQVQLPIPFEATYKVCLKTVPQGYSIAPNQPTCLSKAITMGMGVVDLGTFNVVPTYSATWRVTDGTFDINNQPTLIGPSTFRVTLGAANADAIDNSNADEDPTLGRIAVRFPFPGTYTICEKTPPPNHWNAQQPCKQINVVAGVPLDLGLFVNYEKQVFKP